MQSLPILLHTPHSHMRDLIGRTLQTSTPFSSDSNIGNHQCRPLYHIALTPEPLSTLGPRKVGAWQCNFCCGMLMASPQQCLSLRMNAHGTTYSYSQKLGRSRTCNHQTSLGTHASPHLVLSSMHVHAEAQVALHVTWLMCLQTGLSSGGTRSQDPFCG